MLKRLAAFLGILVVGSALFAGEDWQPQIIGPFSGVNNRDNSFAIPATNAQDVLNVNITPGGKSVFKRKGYGTTFTLGITTSGVHGVYTFFDASGNTVDLFANDTYLTSSVSGSNPTVLFSTGPNGATYQCTDSLGFAYCANTSRTNIVKTNGVTYSFINNVASTGTMIASCPTRLAMAGFSDRPNGIDFSADSDFTTWGTGSLGTSAVQLTINAPGPKITMLVYAFGRLMWFKNSSFGYVLLGTQALQTDWVIRTVSNDVGTNDNSYIFREGILYFRGQDSHIYAFDGSNYKRLSQEIGETIRLSQFRTSSYWTQTSAADFSGGASFPAGWIDTSTISGLLYLASTTAPSPLIDTSAADFAQGTPVNVSTSVSPGTLSLAFTTQNPLNSFYPGTDGSSCGSDLCTEYFNQARRVLITTTTFASAITLRLKKTGSPGQFRMDIVQDNGSGNLGSTLESVNVDANSVSTSVGDVTVNFGSTTILTAGTSYWFRLIPLGTCDTSNKIEWMGTGGVGGTTGNIACGAYVVSGAFPSLAYKLYGTTYTTSGTYLSRAFDIGFTTNTWLFSWSTFTATYVVSPGVTGISFETQTSSSATGDFTGFVGASSGSLVTSPVQQFIRYQATLTTNDPTITPTLSDVTINLSDRVRPSATYYSAVKNAASITTWDTFQVTKSDYFGSHTFYIRSSTNPITVTSSTPTWTAISPGTRPSISTGTYFQIRDTIVTTSHAPTSPILYDFTLNWFEGSATDKMYCTYFNDALWFAVAYGQSASTNNRILYYDLINQTWLLYDIPSNGFYVRQNRLYMGSPLGGYVYKYGDSDNDNGGAINAYWKSKDFYGNSPFSTQELANISLSGKTVANSSMTITYTLNGMTSTSFQMSLNSTTNQFVSKNKNLPIGTIGNTYNIQFGNNSADQPFEIFGVQVGIRPKTWIPTP